MKKLEDYFICLISLIVVSIIFITICGGIIIISLLALIFSPIIALNSKLTYSIISAAKET